jgi:DNA-binding transcriptional MocR family regulator
MYLQIMEQIKRRIAVGDWKAGEALPSIRQLAADLQVSVITVKRAYLELEREGVIATQHGKGLGGRWPKRDRRPPLRGGARPATRAGGATRPAARHQPEGNAGAAP